MTPRFALVLLGLLTATRLLVAAFLPLAPDEAYYRVWSRALAPGYPDHPPMVALWIAAGTQIAGAGAFGVRLLAPVAAALGSVLLARAADDLLPGRRAGIAAAALLNATLLFGVGSVTMTPDTPLLLFWTATIWALARLAATGNGRWWLVAGVAAGLALDSKYTAVLLAPAVLAWLALSPRMRPWLRRPQPWLAAAVACALFLPVLAWNAAHGWASFVRQGSRAGDWRPGRALQFLAELVGGQVGLATPLLAVLFTAGIVAALRHAWRREAGLREAGWTLLALTTALPLAVFVQHALGDRVQANWPSVVYPSAAIAAAGLAARLNRLRAPAISLGAVITGLVWLQGLAAPLPLPRAIDPALMRLGGWSGLAAAVRDAAAGAGARYVACDSYGIAAELAWLLPPDLPVIGVDPRWALFRLPPAAPVIEGRPGLLVRTERRADPPDAAPWSALLPAGEVARSRGGVVAETYRLYRVEGRAGATGAVILPSAGANPP